MGGVGLVARSAIRREWRSLLVIMLLVGLAGTVVLATVAGARRTATSLDRFTAYSQPADLEIDTRDPTPEQMRSFRHQPGVAAVAQLHQMNLVLSNGEFLPTAAAINRDFGTIVDRPRVVKGHLPRPSAPLELAIGETLSQRLGVGVGDTATFHSYSKAQTDRAITTNGDPGPPSGPVVHFRVVAVVRRPLDLGVRGGPGGVVVPTPAFLARYGDKIGSFTGEVLRVRVSDGTGVADVVSAARRIFGRSLTFTTLSVETEGARDAIDVLTIALWVFAGVATLASLVAVGIVASRQIESENRDQAVLASLGLTRGQRALAAGALVLPAALGGATLAVLGAALASPLLPFGVARKAETNPGFRFDGVVLGAGFVTIIAFVVVVAAIAGQRVARSATGGRAQRELARPSAVARAAAGTGLSPSMTTGLRLALEPGRGGTAVPVRSAFAGAVMGTAGVVAVLMFSASLGHLAATPRLYGWSFDTVVLPGSQAFAAPGNGGVCDERNRAVTGDKEFGAVAVLCTFDVEIDGRPTQGWGFRSLRGSIDPTVVVGRAPRDKSEVALGVATLEAVGKQIGDTVGVRAQAGTKRFRIVGQVVFPSPAGDDARALADGAAFSAAGLSQIVQTEDNVNTSFVARFAAGVNTADLPHAGQDLGQPASVGNAARYKLAIGTGVPPNVPVEIDRLRQVDQLPTILGALLGLLAATAVGHAIVLAVRRRRRDLAVLRTLGFERSQVRTSVAVMATTHAALGLVVGIPFGIAVGRLVWRGIADNLGVASVFEVSMLALLIVVGVAIFFANLMGVLAARSAIRTRPAAVLRTE